MYNKNKEICQQCITVILNLHFIAQSEVKIQLKLSSDKSYSSSRMFVHCTRMLKTNI